MRIGIYPSLFYYVDFESFFINKSLSVKNCKLLPYSISHLCRYACLSSCGCWKSLIPCYTYSTLCIEHGGFIAHSAAKMSFYIFFSNSPTDSSLSNSMASSQSSLYLSCAEYWTRSLCVCVWYSFIVKFSKKDTLNFYLFLSIWFIYIV